MGLSPFIFRRVTVLNIISELENHGVLFNEDTLESILKPITSREDLQDEFLSEQRVFYYTANSRSIREYSFNASDDSVFKIVKFPNTRNFFNHPWSFGFIKQETEEGTVWRGAYAGRHGELFTKLKKVVRSPEGSRLLLSKVDFPRAITRVDVFKKFEANKVTKDIYDNLSDRQEWHCLGGLNGLQIYLKNLTYVARDKALFKKDLPEEYLLKKDNSGYTLVFNSGLFDKYLNFIMLKAELSLCNNSFLSEPYYAVKSLSQITNLSDYGLEEALPVMQFCDKASLVFPSDKINLVDRQGLDHIFTDRYSRLSLELQSCSPEVLYTSLKYSVGLALKRSKVDTQYLVPFLNMKWDKVSYLMPFFIRHIDNDNPLCAIVIGEVSPGVWAPVTTLKLETARSNARLLGRLNASWLTNVKGGIVDEDCEG